MIVKLKDADIDFSLITELKKIKQNLKNKNSFIKIPEKIETRKQKDEWENEKIIEQNIERDFQKDLNKKIEYSNIRAEQMKKMDITLNTLMNNNSIINSFENDINNNLIKTEDNEEEIKFDEIFDKMENEEEILLFDNEEDKKIEKNTITFSIDKGKDKPLSKM